MTCNLGDEAFEVLVRYLKKLLLLKKMNNVLCLIPLLGWRMCFIHLQKQKSKYRFEFRVLNKVGRKFRENGKWPEVEACTTMPTQVVCSRFSSKEWLGLSRLNLIAHQQRARCVSVHQAWPHWPTWEEHVFLPDLQLRCCLRQPNQILISSWFIF